MRKFEQTVTTRVLARCDELAAISELNDGVLRQYLTPEHQRANQLMARYLTEAGLASWQDSVGNQWGRLPSANPDAPRLVLGSHLDTVPYAGKYDGILGVLIAIEMLTFFSTQEPLPFHLDVVGFGDEEGTRFGTTLIGSKAVANGFEGHWLELRDKHQVTMAEAFTAFGLSTQSVHQPPVARESLLGYWELHIDQGPGLESRHLPIGIVTGIAGAKRATIRIAGMAGHAGTTPMSLRRDAIAAAAELIQFIERSAFAGEQGEVATVGNMTVTPGAANVIAGRCELALDVRALDDSLRDQLIDKITRQARVIAKRRNVDIVFDWYHNAAAVLCEQSFQDVFTLAVQQAGEDPFWLPSGAGHDAMAIAAVAPVGMLFIRSPGGISHHPSETVMTDDVGIALDVFATAIANYALARS